jgi:hypothetical protein
MTTLRWLSVILLFVASSLPAQTRTVAERTNAAHDAGAISYASLHCRLRWL